MTSQASVYTIPDSQEESEFELTMRKLLTPTPEDLIRKVTNEELTELCLKRKVKVCMQWWNPVNDYVRLFRKQKRLQNKTPTKINKLLAKAVNRYKDTHCYTADEIKEFHEKDWQFRKKYHLLLLNQWEYERQHSQSQRELSQLNSTGESHVLPYIEIPNANDSIGRETNKIVREDTADEPTNSMCNLLAHVENENAASNKNINSDITRCNSEKTASGGSNTGSLTMALMINTCSMSIATEDLLESNPLLEDASERNNALSKVHKSKEISGSENVAAYVEVVNSGQIDYNDFNQFIPMTSTQSQQSTQTQPSEINILD